MATDDVTDIGKPIGPTFADELVAAGIGNIPISWADKGLIYGRNALPTDQKATLDGVTAAHDASKKLGTVLTSDWIARWTNQEYLALEKQRAADITANKVGNAKNWDILTADTTIVLTRQKAQTLKADLVADGVLTQARADVIFSP